MEPRLETPYPPPPRPDPKPPAPSPDPGPPGPPTPDPGPPTPTPQPPAPEIAVGLLREAGIVASERQGLWAYYPGRRYVDWDLPDRKGRPLDAVRATRDEIAARVKVLVAELDQAPAAPE